MVTRLDQGTPMALALLALLALAALIVALKALGDAREACRLANRAEARAAVAITAVDALPERPAPPTAAPAASRPDPVPVYTRADLDPDKLAAAVSGTIEDRIAEAGPPPPDPWADRHNR